MSYLVLARKWRPATFAEVVGQEGVVRTLQNAIRLQRVAHAYLFCGPRGVGKTTVARLLAKALNCHSGPTPEPDNSCPACREIADGRSPDVFEIDGASNTGVDDVRSLRENARYLPAASRFKIYIIDEVHMLSTSAFNALLKTLEEPPEHVKFIFATTEPHKIPLTVLSRCQRFDFKRIPGPVILERLRQVLEAEGVRVEPEALRLISREAGGSMRDALSLTDQVLAFSGEAVDLERAEQALGLTRAGLGFEVIDQALEERAGDLAQTVEKLFDSGADLKRFLELLLWHVRNLLLCRTLGKAADELMDLMPEERERLQRQAQRAEPVRWHQMFDLLSRTLDELGRHPVPRLAVETALLRLACLERLVDVGELIERVEELARGGSGGPPPSSGSPGRRAPERRPPEPGGHDAGPVEKNSAPEEDEQDFPPQWRQLVGLASSRRPAFGAMLRHLVPREVGPKLLRLGVPKGSFFAEQVRAPDNRALLEKFSREVFGNPVKLVFEETDAKGSGSIAELEERHSQQADDEMRRQAVSHPSVQQAIRILGAQVEQVRPPKEPES